MQRIRPAPGPHGWPLWILWAALPIILSIGFVTGMGLANYQLTSPPAVVAPLPPVTEHSPDLPLVGQLVPPPPAPEQRGTEPTTDPGPDPRSVQGSVPVPGMDPGPVPGPGGNTLAQPPLSHSDTWQIPTPSLPLQPEGASARLAAPPPQFDEPLDGPLTFRNEPEQIYQTGLEAQNAREARALLARAFGRYSGGITIDYQMMRNSGVSSSLVGMLSVQQYPLWAKALRDQPDQLHDWLNAASTSVAPAVNRDHFFLAWAVVDVVSSRPSGFAAHEVTPLDDGRFLVIRPLASTSEQTHSLVTLRSSESLNQSTAGRPGSGAWFTYGPVIRFDNTDLYRPPALTNTKPAR